MAATVGLIKNITEALLGIGEVSIDNFTFKLFYKWYKLNFHFHVQRHILLHVFLQVQVSNRNVLLGRRHF